jgi:hypothetical protein
MRSDEDGDGYARCSTVGQVCRDEAGTKQARKTTATNERQRTRKPRVYALFAPYRRHPPVARSFLQAGGRRFDPGWLHKYLQMEPFL